MRSKDSPLFHVAAVQSDRLRATPEARPAPVSAALRQREHVDGIAVVRKPQLRRHGARHLPRARAAEGGRDRDVLLTVDRERRSGSPAPTCRAAFPTAPCRSSRRRRGSSDRCRPRRRRRRRSRAPPVMNVARCSTLHTSFIVRTSKAASLPTLPSVPGISKKRRRAPVPPPPSRSSTAIA